MVHFYAGSYMCLLFLEFIIVITIIIITSGALE